MTIEPFRKEDIAIFLGLAASERWVAEQWEFDFLLSSFPAGCLCGRDEAGKGIGFVTSLRHERSGWIGNLIVSAEYRGRGIGEALFLRAVHALREAGADTVWLTASKTGRSIYEKHGFAAIDTIVRWTGFGRQRHAEHDPKPGSAVTTPSASGIDNQAWGDRRDTLLAATVGRGKLLIEESGFLVIQPCGNAKQFGPFSAQDNSTAEHLFDAALHTIPLGTKVCLDAPASNRAALLLFNRRRMRIAGTNELMYAGIKPEYRPELLYGLATMGSCG
jgi:ribosomal protein S18 acetylase RimI-like enzyme